MSKKKKSAKQPLIKPYPGPSKAQPPEVYIVEFLEHGRVRYVREDMVPDMVPDKMAQIMERIAIAQEKQARFYEKYDGMIAPLMDMASKAIKQQVKKMNSSWL